MGDPRSSLAASHLRAAARIMRDVGRAAEAEEADALADRIDPPKRYSAALPESAAGPGYVDL